MAEAEKEPEEYRFWEMPEAPADPKIKHLAACVADQQRAGFKDLIDLREVQCPDCGAPGYNTGWGFFSYLCGAEAVGEDDFKSCKEASA